MFTPTAMSSNLIPFPAKFNFTLLLSSSPNTPTSSLLPSSSLLSFSTRLHSHASKPHYHHHLPLLATSPNSPAPSVDDQSEEFRQAQEALFEFVQAFGVSHEDSAAISSGSPRYLQMLVDGVRDLDEHELWSSWKSDDEEKGLKLKGFKEKVSYMAMEKGDNGKVAFLESFVGLSLSSAMNVARYLSAETLPGLIGKVKYMKEIFFSGSDDGGIIGKNSRRMMMHLSIPVDDDLQQTLAFFEKIEARRGGLDMLGSKDISFRYLVESFPRLLLLPLDSQISTLVGFLEKIGISGEYMRNILLLFPPIMFFNIKVIKTRMLAFKELSMDERDIGKMLKKYPWVIATSIQENYKDVSIYFDKEKVVSLLEEVGFDKETIGKILCRCPEIFATSIERTLKRKLKFLSAIGISEVHYPRVIKKYPELLVSDIDRTLLPRMKYLVNMGLSRRDVAFMVRRFSPLLGYSIEEVMRPKLDFLVNTMEKPLREVVDYPRFLSYSLEKKIKPRFWALKQRNIECSLKDMLGKNDEEFASEFLQAETTEVPPSLSPF
ncbi:transcription termination factor MTERF6, chloroplastic/mitochondrial isoform X2 [Cannabis sativa]|uniref:transcription termination factor MTERF6, chloroplastic/mitochondrial isoform X2 n=1 Tax=Cannabis sativa TaxID=3483 RepID=UPI0029CA8C0C|nr:transcription termination factor MTERF6, chloroplastic/mitochondrial isoform X2 [Cannabis sativa]